MKKVSSSVALFLRTHLFAQGVNKNNSIDSDKFSVPGNDAIQYSNPSEYKTPSLQATRKFKIALISTYAFIISLFIGIVYISEWLDPKFPF
jgi:hypothetical protein